MSKVISLGAGLFLKWATQTNKWRVGLKKRFPHLCFLNKHMMDDDTMSCEMSTTQSFTLGISKWTP